MPLFSGSSGGNPGVHEHDPTLPLNRRLFPAAAADEVRSMLRNLHGTASTAFARMRGAARSRALAEVDVLDRIKQEMATLAGRLGFSRACRNAIPVCGGECCRWHFPKHLTAVDFFLSLHHLSPTRRRALAAQLRPRGMIRYQCPLLTETGCFFSFAARPMTCTAAYPCFATQDYWDFCRARQPAVTSAREVLAEVIRRVAAPEKCRVAHDA